MTTSSWRERDVPKLHDHLRQVDRNIRFLQDCERKNCHHTREYPEWGVVVRFYLSMHIVEAMLSLGGVHSRSHTERNKHVMRTRGMFSRRFQLGYADLYSMSRTARYLAGNGRGVEESEVTAAARHVTLIRNEARSFLRSRLEETASISRWL